MKVDIGDFEKNKKRKINIKIDSWDVYNADVTLALIIVAVLKNYKKVCQGYPNLDWQDTEYTKKEWYKIGYMSAMKEWKKIIDEMIYAFDKCANLGWEDNPLGNKKFEQDQKVEKEHERIKNGLELFSKYFTSLWN